MKVPAGEKYGRGGRMIDVVIVAAGEGSRMGGCYKQFLDLDGKPLVYHTVKRFTNYGVEKITLVVPEEKLEYSEKMVRGLGDNIIVIKGGKRRQESVLAGLNECKSEIILLHDGVRPFVKKGLINKVVKGTREYGTCAPGIPLTDTIKLYSEDKILWTKGRRNILQVQTPQGFKSDILKEVVGLLKEEDVTDELSVVERLDGCIHWVLGDSMNIKITYPEDMELARIIAKNWRDE